MRLLIVLILVSLSRCVRVRVDPRGKHFHPFIVYEFQDTADAGVSVRGCRSIVVQQSLSKSFFFDPYQLEPHFRDLGLNYTLVSASSVDLEVPVTSSKALPMDLYVRITPDWFSSRGLEFDVPLHIRYQPAHIIESIQPWYMINRTSSRQHIELPQVECIPDTADRNHRQLKVSTTTGQDRLEISVPYATLTLTQFYLVQLSTVFIIVASSLYLGYRVISQ